jgi:hypothetical protein
MNAGTSAYSAQSKECWANAAHPAGGYILIYVLGILIFLSITILGVAYAVRINAQSVLYEKESVQDQYVLDSALQYTYAQLLKTRAATPVVNALDPDQLEKLKLWKVGGGPYEITILDRPLEVSIEDGASRPDINLVSQGELQRIFFFLGAPGQEEAAKWAAAVVKARDAASSTGGDGFASIDQVLALEEIPARYRFGYEEGGSHQPGLADLFTAGTGSKTVNPNIAPLPLIGILTGASPDKLREFEQARRAKPLTVADAVTILGESARFALHDGVSSVYRIELGMAGGGTGPQVEALVRDAGTRFDVISYKRIEPGSE